MLFAKVGSGKRNTALVREIFPNHLQGEFLDDARSFKLTRDLVYIGRTLTIGIPAGFITDFNSVPRGLWNFFPPWEYPEAGVVHDWLYREPIHSVSRATADGIHRDILKILGCPLHKRILIYTALRTFGGRAWK